MPIKTKFSDLPNSAMTLAKMHMLIPSFYLKQGGSINIKPENKGKFTSWAKSQGMNVQEAAKHVMAHKGEYSSTIVKRANFAKNAGTKFKRANGGTVDPPDGNSGRLTSDKIAQIRRIGFTQGWSPTPNADGSIKLTRDDAFGSYFKPGALNPNNAVSKYKMSSRNSFEDLPHLGARKVAGQYMRNFPELESAEYGEVDFSRIPGFEGNNSGIVNDLFEMTYRPKKMPDVTINRPLPKMVAEMKMTPRIGYKNLLDAGYSPDGVTTKQHMTNIMNKNKQIKLENEGIKEKNKYNDVLNLLRTRFNEKQRKDNPNATFI